MSHGYSSCPCLPDKIWGQDTDSVFAYQTPKIVKIQDRSLGLIRLSLVLLIIGYVFFYSMWYKGGHFKESQIQGIARLQWQEPVQRCNPKHIDCEANFVSMKKLPYCSDYTGKNASAVVGDCRFYDARQLPIELRSGCLLPTRKDMFKQTRDCAADGPECTRPFQFVNADGKAQVGAGEAEPIESIFVADIEDFTLAIDHSFRTDDNIMACTNQYMQGYWEKCDANSENCITQPLECAHGDCGDVGKIKCPRRIKDEFDQYVESYISFIDAAQVNSSSLRSRHAPKHRRAVGRPARASLLLDASGGLTKAEEEAMSARRDEDVALSISAGDVFSLKTLLAMAGKTLEDVVDTGDGDRPRTIRSRGTAIVVSIVYWNWVPWTLWHTLNPPKYTISVTTRPVTEFKQQSVSSDTSSTRQLVIDYGVLVILEQEGHLWFPNAMHTIVTFAGAMVLLSMSNVLTDLIAIYALPRSAVYKELKFEESADLVPDKT